MPPPCRTGERGNRESFMKSWTVVFLAALSVVLVVAARHQAWAHASLVSSTPAGGQALADPPKEIVLSFTEAVGPVFFRVLDKSGKEVGSPAQPQPDGNSLRLPLNDALPNGTYIVTYRVVSEDTHPIGGTFAFAIGEALAVGAAATPAVAATPTVWTWASGANRWALYTAMLLATGAALFYLWMTVPAAADEANLRVGRRAAVVAAVTYVLAVGLGGADLVNGGADALFTSAAWRQGAQTTLLPSALIGLFAMAILYFALRQRSRVSLAVAAFFAVVSFLVTGHAALASPIWVMAPMVAIHLVCAAFWLAALIPLFVTAREEPVTDAGFVMTQFSGRAVYTVTALIASGAVITWIQVETLAAFTNTVYGPRLLIKLGLFAVLLGLAAYNKFVLTPNLERAEDGAAPALRRSIVVELVIYTLILGAAASLTLTPPPRAITAEATQGGYRTSVTSDGYEAEIEVSPATPGQNMLMVSVRKDGQPVELKGMDITLALPSAGVSDVEKRGEAAGPMWHFNLEETALSGEWEVQARAFITDFDAIDFTFKMPIK